MEPGRSLSYRPRISEERETEELIEAERKREAEEESLAQDPGETDAELAQHERRAEKAHYLREKLEERAESEGEK